MKSLTSVWRVISCTVMFWLSSMVCADSNISNRIDGLFEPSGVIQLIDGRFLVVEDESSNPLVLLKYIDSNNSFSLEPLKTDIFQAIITSKLSDLEAITQSIKGTVYAMTSHSRKSNGKRSAKREQFIQLSVNGDRLTRSRVRSDFRHSAIKAFPVLKESGKEHDVKDEGGFNIEGMAFTPNSEWLWIGLRAPLIDNKAVLLLLQNAKNALGNNEPFQFSKDPVLLDLAGGGIRDIVYDETLSGYLILSHREDTKKDKAFKLWLWTGDKKAPVQRVRINGIKKLMRTEGISSARINDRNFLLLLNDDGDRGNNKAASYHLVDYSRLRVE